jgi:hypothetical protein
MTAIDSEKAIGALFSHKSVRNKDHNILGDMWFGTKGIEAARENMFRAS